jgi:4-diphosphocytidyl-2C-methyl-D-erythritol kinase
MVVVEEGEEENLRALAMRVGSDIVVMKPITCKAIGQKVEDMLISKEPPFLETKRAKLQHRY